MARNAILIKYHSEAFFACTKSDERKIRKTHNKFIPSWYRIVKLKL
jgi:hypothetical protein